VTLEILGCRFDDLGNESGVAADLAIHSGLYAGGWKKATARSG